MSSKSLLERQKDLVEFLCDPRAFKASPGTQQTSSPIPGIDGARLKLIGEQALQKRFEKIRAVLPKSFDVMGSDIGPLFEDFAHRYPPSHIGRLENARQFVEFVSERRHSSPFYSPFLTDLLKFEFALWSARFDQKSGRDGGARDKRQKEFRSSRMVCLAHSVQLLLLNHDIRPLLEHSGNKESIRPRKTYLAIRFDAELDDVRIFEVSRKIYEILNGLSRPSRVGEETLASQSDILQELAERGIVTWLQ